MLLISNFKWKSGFQCSNLKSLIKGSVTIISRLNKSKNINNHRFKEGMKFKLAGISGGA